MLLSLLDPPDLGELNREKLLLNEAAAGVSGYLNGYAETTGLYMKINYVNADHVHTFVGLPTELAIEEVVQLLKGSSSHWINADNVIRENLHGAEATALLGI